MTTRRLLNPQLGFVFIPEDDIETDPRFEEIDELSKYESPDFFLKGLEEEDPSLSLGEEEDPYGDWEEPDIDEAQEWEPIEGPDDYHYLDYYYDSDLGDIFFTDDGDF